MYLGCKLLAKDLTAVYFENTFMLLACALFHGNEWLFWQGWEGGGHRWSPAPSGFEERVCLGTACGGGGPRGARPLCGLSQERAFPAASLTPRCAWLDVSAFQRGRGVLNGVPVLGKLWGAERKPAAGICGRWLVPRVGRQHAEVSGGRGGSRRSDRPGN